MVFRKRLLNSYWPLQCCVCRGSCLPLRQIDGNYYLVIKRIISTFAPLKPETRKAVDYLKEFVIPFIGLSTGNHRFSFLIDDKFFASFEEAEIGQAVVKVELDLNRMERMLVLNFSIKGSIRVTCSRCLGEFDLPVEGDEEFFVKFGDSYAEEDDNVMIIPERETHIDIAPLIYDYLHLMVPYRVVHPGDEHGVSGCDPEVIRHLDELSAEKEADHRWDKLKDINFE